MVNNSAELNDGMVTVTEEQFRSIFREVFDECSGYCDIDEIYQALQSTNPPFEQDLAIHMLHRKNRHNSEPEEGRIVAPETYIANDSPRIPLTPAGEPNPANMEQTGSPSRARQFAVAVEIPRRKKEEVYLDPDCKSPALHVNRRSLRVKRKDDSCSNNTSVSEGTNGENGYPAPKKVKKEPRISCYTPRPHELLENDQLVIIGEDPEPSSADQRADDIDDDVNMADDSLPIRTLDDFVLFDEASQKKRMVGLEEIGSSKNGKERDIRAVGIVKPQLLESGEDDSEIEDELGGLCDDGQLVCLSAIYWWETDGQDVWLRTQYAYYKLLTPAAEYSRFIAPVLTQVKLSSTFIAAIVENPDMRLEEFFKILPNISTSVSLNAKDVKREAPHIQAEVDAWIDDLLSSSNSELLEAVLNSQLYRDLLQLSGGRKSESGARRRATQKNYNEAVLRHLNPTTVTPWIARVAGSLFVRTLMVAHGKQAGIGEAKKVEDSEDVDKYLIDMTCDPATARRDAWSGSDYTKKVQWMGNVIWQDGDLGRKGYDEVEIDGQRYKCGDCVSLRPGVDESIEMHRKKNKRNVQQPDSDPATSQERSETASSTQSELWFARLVYMWSENGLKMGHFRWFDHGGDTVLEETAGSRELFLLDECDDNPLESIAGKVQVDKLRADEKEPLGLKEKNKFFYRFFYDRDNATFEDPSDHEDFTSSYQHCPQFQECDSCELIYRKNETEHSIAHPNNGEISYKGVVYREKDFAYYIPISAEPNTPYAIGQIISIADAEIEIRILSRDDGKNKYTLAASYEETLRGKPPFIRDNRKLYFTDNIAAISVKHLQGKCLVMHLGDIDDLSLYKDREGTFWVDTRLGYSEPSLREEKQLQKDLAEFLASTGEKKIRAMDIFAGAGGLTIGMDKSEIVETRWAIEFAPSAAIAFKHNLRNTIVYNQCANLLLERAIQQEAGVELSDLTDFQRKPCAKMPHRGEVEFIYGGPPCQGFSGANRFKKTNDIKNSLIATFLSYVDFYNPVYVLLENVRGLVGHKLGGKQVGNRIEGGIQLGTVKFILRALTSMGYQCRWGILQAGQYGVPQSRRRVFFWGTKLGTRLPTFPQPSHCFLRDSSCTVTLPNGKKISTNKGSKGYAPHPAVLVGDVMLDLPGFEFINPHLKCPATLEQEKEEMARSKFYRQYDVSKCQRFVGEIKQSYISPPLSEFQRKLREDVPLDGLTCHFTKTFDALTVERVTTIDMYPGADHRTLPESLKPWCLSHPDSKASKYNFWPGLFGRLDYDGTFQTALTDIIPMSKQGTIIHPSQRRVITVREHARSQGFPDWYVFLSDGDRTKEMHRQIGNAVPIPLAHALGRKLMESKFGQWKSDREQTQRHESMKGKGKESHKNLHTTREEASRRKVTGPGASGVEAEVEVRQAVLRTQVAVEIPSD